MDLKDRKALERELNELKKSYRDILNSNIKLSDELRWTIEEKKQLQQENQELNGQLKKQKGVIDKAIDKLNIFIKCCKAAKIESDSDYFHYQYWDMFERLNKKLKQILEDKEV